MKKEKYYWKVVYKSDDGFISSVIANGKYCLTYELGKEVIAPRQGIFVFEKRRQARSYRHYQNSSTDGNPYKILKVKATGKEIQYPIFYDVSMLERNKCIFSFGNHFPTGTKCFKSIIPIEVVY